MKLNPDCIRAVILQAEALHTITQLDDGSMLKGHLSIYTLYDAILNFSNEDIFYAVFNLHQAGYLDVSFRWLGSAVTECDINHITYEGHEFIERIRDDKRWTVIRSGLNALASYSISAINAIAEGVTAGAVSAYLNKP